MMDDRSSVVACLKIAMYLTWLLGYGYNGYTVSHIAYLQILQYMAILTLFTNPYRIGRVQKDVNTLYIHPTQYHLKY